MKPEDFIMLPIPAARYTEVCALLGGAAMIAVSSGAAQARGNAPSTSAPINGISDTDNGSTLSSDTGSPVEAPVSASAGAADDNGEVDAHGHPWSADMHAATKGKTKDGLWRMKVGVSRPDPLPGFPKVDTDAGNGAADTSAPAAIAGPAPIEPGTQSAPAADDDDEFAAFRNAAASSAATDTAAAAAAPARQWSDADLGALCNQAAVKLGDPSPVKAIIAEYTPEGQVAHSRNIPAEQREAFAAAVEAKAGITFAG